MEPKNEQAQIDALADKASQLIDRRSAMKATGRALVLPALITLGIPRAAMGMVGSGPSQGSGGNNSTRIRNARQQHQNNHSNLNNNG